MCSVGVPVAAVVVLCMLLCVFVVGWCVLVCVCVFSRRGGRMFLFSCVFSCSFLCTFLRSLLLLSRHCVFLQCSPTPPTLWGHATRGLAIRGLAPEGEGAAQGDGKEDGVGYGEGPPEREKQLQFTFAFLTVAVSGSAGEQAAANTLEWLAQHFPDQPRPSPNMSDAEPIGFLAAVKGRRLQWEI